MHSANQNLPGTVVGQRRPLSQASVGLVVAGLHLAGLMLWWTLDHGMRLPPRAARLPSIAVWLPALAKPVDQAPKLPSRRQQPAPDTTAKPRPHDGSKPIDSTPTVDATPVSASNGISLPTEASGPIEPPVQTKPSLNLSLSAKDVKSAAPRSFAEQSPFQGRKPKTVERQIANAAAATGPWTEERMDNDHIRFRRGNTCIVMERPRAAAIDPMNEAAGRLPWRRSSAEECND
nr:hypothetical protein [Rhodoferax sp.]